MKLPSRHIIILLIVSLTALFGYQIYWLSGLYRTSVRSKESQIEIAFQKADDAEMMERLRSVKAGGRHGTLEVNTGWSDVKEHTEVTVRTDSVSINMDGSKSVSVTSGSVRRT